jgi:hypothetical protein
MFSRDSRSIRSVHVDARRTAQVLDCPGRLNLERRGAEEQAARLGLREHRYRQQQERDRQKPDRMRQREPHAIQPPATVTSSATA